MTRSAHSSDGLVAWGKHGNELRYVLDVPRGKACGCVCVRCDHPLVAKKGRKRRPHFAHAGESDCDGGAETVLHRLAKEIVEQLPSIGLPEYRFTRSYSTRRFGQTSLERVIFPATRVSIDRVLVETKVGPIKPDLIIERGSRRLLVEIEVTHSVDRAKLRAVRTLDLAMLTIRLDPSLAGLTRDELRAVIDGNDRCKQWAFNPRQRAVEGEWIRQLREFRRRARLRKRADFEAFFRSLRRPDSPSPRVQRMRPIEAPTTPDGVASATPPDSSPLADSPDPVDVLRPNRPRRPRL